MTEILQLNREDLRMELQSIFLLMQADANRQAENRIKECLLTPEETAKKLSISSVTLWRWCKSGYLKPVFVGGQKRYRSTDIEKIFDNQSRKALEG